MEYEGLAFETSPDVYEPAEDTFLAAEHLGLLLAAHEGGSISVLDMGCGTGLLGMIAASSEKVSDVLFCDKNEKALALARKNCESNEKKINAECLFVLSDLFSKIQKSKKFDLMIFNTPYLPKEQLSPRLSSDETAWNGGDKGIETAEKFLKQAVSHLSEEGEVLLVSSSFADLPALLENASKMGYEAVDELKKHIFFEDIVTILLKKATLPPRDGKQK